MTALPLEEYGFSLHKSAIRDAIALRYNWSLERVPTSCSCGSSFSIEHALSCAKGCYPSIRHNEIRDLTANLVTEVCSNVSVEPMLQPITGETFRGASTNAQEGARLDIAADGFWGGHFERAFVDVRVFNPYTASNQHQQQSAVYRKHENEKKRMYEQRIREVEHGSFTPHWWTWKLCNCLLQGTGLDVSS